MGHYSDLFESVTAREIELKITENKEYLERTDKRKKNILKDMESSLISKETKEACRDYLRGTLNVWINEAVRKDKELSRCMMDFQNGKEVQRHRIL
ncbi:hypothetical protein [Rossellomorea marisflavi]|uniref:hypothetical protein n=1 Tax=Rossellomorea marisflavi TaxID=189381 RepID=UPI003F9F441A